MPVANVDKVRKRQSQQNHDYPEDDLNQSYVFDANEDWRGRQEDEKAEAAAKTLRQKKRELESQYGSNKIGGGGRPPKNHNRSGDSLNYNNNSNPHNTFGTLDMNTSDDSIGIDDLHQSFSNDDIANGGANRKKKKKKKKKKTQQLDDHIDHPSRDERFNRSRDSGENSMNSAGGNNNNNNNPKRVVKMRDTERLVRKNNPGMQRQDSFRPNNALQRQDSNRPSMNGRRQDSADFRRQDNSNRPSMNGRRQDSADFRRQQQPHGPHGGTMVVRQQPAEPQGRGRPTMPRANTARPGMMRQRSGSLDPSGHYPNHNRSDGNIGYNHHASAPPRARGRSQSIDRSRSQGAMIVRQNSYSGPPPPGPAPRGRSRSMQRPPQTMPLPMQQRTRSHSNTSTGSRRSALSRDGSTTVIKQGGKTVYLVPMTAKEAAELTRNPNKLSKDHPYGKYRLQKKLQVEETPPRSLILIWAIVMAELGFDLGTTIIAFQALLGEGNCCGQPMQLGPIPMSVTSPFFLLVIAELVFLCRAVILTLWPSILTKRTQDEYDEERAIEDQEEKGHSWYRTCCCCLKWNARAILKVLNFLVLLNPFFGCVIAWILLYQSDKTEAFIVLGLEGGSIILHFISVYLEGGLDTCGSILFHCIPLLPFIASVTMVLIYLQYGGVCYIVDRNNFFYWGCEICDNGFPPINNTCTINGTNITIPVVSNSIFDVSFNTSDLSNLNAIKDELLATTTQGEYCQANNPGGPPGDFCFFPY